MTPRRRRPMLAATAVPYRITGRCDHCAASVELTWSPKRVRWVCADCGSHHIWVPDPGSEYARTAHSCTCDQQANNEGRLMPPKGWVIELGCPVHDPDWQGLRPGGGAA